MTTTESLREIQDLEQHIVTCQEYFNNTKLDDTNVNALENMLKDIKKTMARNTLLNIVNVIEKVVENDELAKDGMPKQFNVHSIQIGSDDTVYLVSREVLGVDMIDKKYVLDSEITLINFKDVTRIF